MNKPQFTPEEGKRYFQNITVRKLKEAIVEKLKRNNIRCYDSAIVQELGGIDNIDNYIKREEDESRKLRQEWEVR